MSDADEIEALLLQAAGGRHPSSMDISPILALIEEGYDLDLHILPGIREAADGAREAISSWRYFIPAIKRRKTKAALVSDGQGISLPVQWICGNDPRYDSLAAQWAAEKKQRRPAPIASKYFKGHGWAFPAAWVR